MQNDKKLSEMIRNFLIDENELRLLEEIEKKSKECNCNKDNDIYKFEIESMKKNIQYKESKIKDLKLELENCLTYIDELRCDIITKSFENLQKDDELKNLKDSLNFLNENNKNLSTKILILKAENENLKNKILEIKNITNTL